MKKWIAIVMAASMALALAACSGNEASDDSSSADSANATLLEIKASNWEFDQQEYVVKQGEPVKILLTNEQGLHGIDIEGLNVKLNNGKSKVITPNKPGTYTIRCNISCGTGHKDMVATLIVE